MLPAASFDELNRLIKAKRSMPYEKYFGEMELTESEKRNEFLWLKSWKKNLHMS